MDSSEEGRTQDQIRQELKNSILELQRMALERAMGGEQAAVAVLSCTSCNRNSCNGAVEAAEAVTP